MTNTTRSCPLIAFEFAATQLILRAAGFITTELSSALIPTGEKETTVILIVKRGDKGTRIEIGSIPVKLHNANRLWTSWQEIANRELMDNFDKQKLRLNAFKSMEQTLEHLEKQGFALKDSAIETTITKPLYH